MKFLCDNCKAKYQIGDDKVAGKAVRMKCRRCGHEIHVSAGSVDEAAHADTSAVVTERSSVLPAPVAAPEAPHAAAAPRWRPQNDRVEDDESTSIMAVPMRAPTGAGRAALPSSGPGFSSPGRYTSGASAGAPGPAGARASGSAAALRHTPAPRPGAPGAVSARAAGAPRPGVSTRGPGAAPITPASPRLGSSPGHEPVGARAPSDAAPGPQPGAPYRAPSSPPQEDWYVGIGGVPLGPVEVAVIREKALAGLVDPDSLVWRDGLDEWKPLKNFPELLEMITSAPPMRSPSAPAGKTGPGASPQARKSRPELSHDGAASAVPASPVRAAEASSLVHAPASIAQASSSPASPVLDRASASASPLPDAARRPSTSPLPVGYTSAAASQARERQSPSADPGPPRTASSFTAVSPMLSPAADRPQSGPQIPIDVLADPFATAAQRPGQPDAPPAPSPKARSAALRTTESAAGLPSITKGESALDLDEPIRVKRSHGLPAFAYAFIAMAAGFGGVAAWVLLSKPQSAPPPPVLPQQTAVVVSAAPSSPPTATAEVEVGEPTTESSGAPVKQGPVVSSGQRPPKATPSGTAAAAPFDTSGFISTVPGPNANGPSASQAGTGTLSQGEIQGIIAQNQPLIKRKCWQPALDARGGEGSTSTRVTVSIVIGASGNVESAKAGGGENFPGLAGCIASRVKGWKFPASSSSTPANIPFVFAGQ